MPPLRSDGRLLETQTSRWRKPGKGDTRPHLDRPTPGRDKSHVSSVANMRLGVCGVKMVVNRLCYHCGNLTIVRGLLVHGQALDDLGPGSPPYRLWPRLQNEFCAGNFPNRDARRTFLH